MRPVTFVIASLVAAALPLTAGSHSEQMVVSAQVIARAVVSIDSMPATIDITAEDVARGYAEIEQPIVITVRTNSRHGYVLQVEKTNEAFTAVELSLPDASMTASSHESWLQRGYVAGGDRIAARARVRIAPGTAAGQYSLPFMFSASPL